MDNERCLSPTQKLLRSSNLTGEALFKKIKLMPPSDHDNVHAGSARQDSRGQRSAGGDPLCHWRQA